ncbi:hypothetical protein G293_04595 [Candidatus Liberibacter africanus PTSAPSY]|uniref:Uncharacterized protein n=1 Tax=Candidatus Liberibacter africanus PTSAPSY TaxID=1277257 RepID=A0A0G3I3T9_LIBAF|nr:hypothetical protein G293_04595 [Candidatus Liberibacter africanus PTSAPSY]
MEAEVVGGAFGANTVGSVSLPKTKNFDQSMIIPIDYKSSSSSTIYIADKKIIYAYSTLLKDGVNIGSSEVFLSLTSRAYVSLFECIEFILLIAIALFIFCIFVQYCRSKNAFK